jgi:hypothetical protein
LNKKRERADKKQKKVLQGAFSSSQDSQGICHTVCHSVTCQNWEIPREHARIPKKPGNEPRWIHEHKPTVEYWRMRCHIERTKVLWFTTSLFL